MIHRHFSHHAVSCESLGCISRLCPGFVFRTIHHLASPYASILQCLQPCAVAVHFLCVCFSAPLISPPCHSSFCIDCSPLPLFLVHLSTHAWPTISSCMSRMHFLSPKEKNGKKKDIIEASLRFCLLISIPNRDGGIKIDCVALVCFRGGRMESFF